jgi:hypothetical protein
MNNQIKRFIPSNDELEGIDNIISNVPELKEMIQNDDTNLETIINAIDNIKSLNENIKTTIKQFFIALQKTNIAYKIYKYSNFRNQEIIEKLLKREEEFKKIIHKLAKKYNDNSRLEELNNMFSTLIVETKNNKPLSKYMSKTLKNIKFHDDFKSIFDNEGIQTYSDEELKNMKSGRKGPTFKNIERITTVNVPSLKNGAEIIKK